MFLMLGGLFLGWALGSNDAANVFGTAVAAKIVRYRTATILASIFIIIGAMTRGAGGIRTLSGLTFQSPVSAFIVSLTAGFTVTIMSAFKLPVSTSQAVIGSIIGVGLSRDAAAVDWSSLVKVVICWVGTPVGAAVAAFLLYPSISWILSLFKMNLVTRSAVLRMSLIVSGCYGAYALGANSTANVTGVFYQPGSGSFYSNISILAFVGGTSISLGVLTFSRNVMMTVGSKLVPLEAYSALVAVLALALTVHMYSFVGVPVSTSQGIVGAVLGIGLFKGVKTINRRTLQRILFGWVCTPVAAGALCFFTARFFL